MIKPIPFALSLPVFARIVNKIGIATRAAVFLLLPIFSFSQTFFGVASSPGDNGSQVTATATVTPPTLMTAGDLVIVYAHFRSSTGTLSLSSNGGQAWSTAVNSNAGNNQNFSIFWCRYNGNNWPSSVTVSGGDGTNPLTAVMYVYRPTNTSKSWTIHQGPNNGAPGSASTAVTITGFNTSVANTVTMGFWGSPDDVSWSGTLPSGWSNTGLSAYYRNTGGNDQSHTAAYCIRTGTATVNNITLNQTIAQLSRTSIISWSEITPPANDNCANATNIVTDSACVNGTSQRTGQTLSEATVEGNGVTATCGTSTSQDVWYKFVAKSKYPTVTVSSLGSSWGTGLRLQLLSGTCGSLTEVACASNAALTPPLTSPLTLGTTYYVRIYKNNATIPTGNNWGFTICVTDALVKAGRMNEVFSRTVLSAPNVLNYPWEVTYGSDNKLWITESKGYKVYRMDPNNGQKVTVLDLSQTSTFYTASADQAFYCQFNNGAGAQGGLAGLALHPNFLDGTVNENNSVYVSYIYSSTSASLFTNRIAMFTFNPSTQRLESPVSIVDTLPGSNDHNSQRMFIAPVTPGGTQYLFYASGDMGAGQGNAFNISRTIKSQFTNSYEGKILRFNLVPDASEGPYAKWIPNDNPYNGFPGVGAQSAVWNIGQRNNQGFAYDKELNILYGSSHGPYSDDEINILKAKTNYGHPLVIGYAADGNYDGDTSIANSRYGAGAPFATVGSGYSACPPISSEASRKAQINATSNGPYRDPIFSAYPGPSTFIDGAPKYIWRNTNGSNGLWPSEGWSGLDLYTNKVIPGWKKSLVAAGLKWGRLIRLKLTPAGDTTLPSRLASGNSTDTVTYFQTTNRVRDLAFGPNGKDIYVVLDNSASTSGPGTNNPVTPACPGCVVKYSFLGYTDNGGKSSIPSTIAVTKGVDNICNDGTTITIDGTNNNLWVPITGPDGNIMAEIHAMGQNLGVVTSSFYQHSGAIRVKSGYHYLNRNMTITPANNTFSTPVKIRLYITEDEFKALDDDPASSITSGISQLKILKNEDPCGDAVASSTEEIAVTNPIAERAFGDTAYVLQGQVTGFSSFYFAAVNLTLPLELVSFKGTLQNDATYLQWETANEFNTSHFVVERSLDSREFNGIGTVNANGSGGNKYSFIDNDVSTLASTVLYYRLKMVDADGQFKYSGVVTIYLSTVTGLSISPNPTSGLTKMSINAASDGSVKWKLRDNNGRTVMQNTIGVNKGSNTVNINISRLPVGQYYMHVTGVGIDKHIKLQKL